MRTDRLLRRMGVVAAALNACAAWAAPPVDWLLERHRSLAQGRGVPSAVAQSAPVFDGVRGWAGANHRLSGPVLDAGATGIGLRAVRTLADDGDGWRVRLGAALSNVRAGTGLPRLSLEGTEVSRVLGPGRLYMSQERRHWGPAWVGSLVLDGATPPLAALGWRKGDDRAFESRWLSWLGPWSADLFVGGLAAHRQPERPWLVGMRVTVQPARGLELGLSRTMQWGGKGRDESLGSFARALVGRDNYDPGNRALEPGNQLAGYDIRYGVHWPSGWSAAVYGQAIGEDEAGHMPYKFLVTAGAEAGGRWASARHFGLPGATWRVFAEWSDTGMKHAYSAHQPGAYRHHMFAQGYTHHGQVLGHPVGGDAELRSVGAIVDSARASVVMALHRGRALPGAQLHRPGAELRGAALALMVPLGGARVGAAWNRWRHDSQRDDFAQLWMDWAW